MGILRQWKNQIYLSKIFENLHAASTGLQTEFTGVHYARKDYESLSAARRVARLDSVRLGEKKTIMEHPPRRVLPGLSYVWLGFGISFVHVTVHSSDRMEKLTMPAVR